MPLETTHKMTAANSKSTFGYSGDFDESNQLAPRQNRTAGKAKDVHGLSQIPHLDVLSSADSSNKFILMLVVFAHVLTIYLLAQKINIQSPQLMHDQPMQLSLIALAAPEPEPRPEIVPIIEPPKPIIEPKPKLKKVVEKVKSIEIPVERLVEATTEKTQEEVPRTSAQPVQEVLEAKAPPQIEQVVEEKIEPPKFGVAYLNNPAPAYPSLSRRAGEEGRVLLRVLVSDAGEAIEVQLDKSSGSERLDQAAITAVKNWRFIPARKNNQALSAYVLVPIKFSLNS